MFLLRWISFMVIAVLAVSFHIAPIYAQETSSTSDTTTNIQTPEPESNKQQNEIDRPQTSPETYSPPGGGDHGRQEGVYVSGRLLDIRLEAIGDAQSGKQQEVYDIELRSGEDKGRNITILGDVNSNPYQLHPRQGDRVVVFQQYDDAGNPVYYLEGFDRRAPLVILIALFVLTLVILSGWQGFKVAASIVISILLIGYILIPSFLNGLNPVPIAMALAVILTFTSTGLSYGWNNKAWITGLGTLGGVLIAYLLSLLFTNWSHLSGLGTEDDRLFFAQNPTLNPHGLLFAGIIIAAMGVIEDVAVSIASGVEQVGIANTKASFKELFTAGMIVGKDHMAAMANTLIFAYVGASLSTLLLFSQYDSNWLKFLNFESVSEEVVRSLAATIGLIFTVPITALFSAWFAVGIQIRKKSKVIVKED